MIRSLGLDAASAVEVLQTSVKKFEDEGLHEDLARECAVRAWPLCDPVWQALGPKFSFASLHPRRLRTLHRIERSSAVPPAKKSTSSILEVVFQATTESRIILQVRLSQ